ncbi:uncharacterized protein C11E3.02c [Aspergillus udagawae]|uniref:Uncharacterized protein C11E3.02c n=1 Tax=Aspergillus udagawae TaxID=91492 RepID=A0A8E0R2L4_9EURO|nr:uncharacterized protein Aud_009793 [Aspergillus udagawae]GFF60305.1 uncharacterized protein C11E3.02c [Aspergillus udagawae]GFF97850.1 uncharacterized protein C11E3.02c [Aspergillus udagawae]GFG06652.1 uncharacterized protein C11E3.02c [Aspergillus udagawae]GIC93308.1 hypothetical protein Aud_009793 [Aspergillus udagawae]
MYEGVVFSSGDEEYEETLRLFHYRFRKPPINPNPVIALPLPLSEHICPSFTPKLTNSAFEHSKTMLSSRILTRRLPQVAARFTAPRASFSQIRRLSAAEIDDPLQNGGYQNPPRVKRALRDPYGDWWDKQERRNFGEPVHEENEILGVFSPEQYNHVTPRKGLFQIGAFIATFLTLCGVVSLYYPDKPSVPKTYPGGLEKELGGASALPARKAGEDSW